MQIPSPAIPACRGGVDVSEKQLAARVYAAAHLAGEFVLRSGAVVDRYFDKYRFEADPVLLRDLAGALVPLLPARVDALAGLELGGVPLATALALETGLPARFVRKTAKDYGTRELAEGGPVSGMRLVLVEDIVTTGGQILLSAADLRARGAEIVGALCVVDRGRGGAEALRADGIALSALFTEAELEAAARG